MTPFEVIEGTLIVVFFAYEIWAAEPMKDRYRRRKLRDTFDLRVVSIGWDLEEPVNGYVTTRLRVNRTTEIHSFNVRFVESKLGGNVSPHTIRIWNLQTPEQQVAMNDDGEGGLECRWKDNLPRKIYEGKDLELTVSFSVKSPAWNGYLSYQGWDALDEKRYARAEVRFTRPEQLRMTAS